MHMCESYHVMYVFTYTYAFTQRNIHVKKAKERKKGMTAHSPNKDNKKENHFWLQFDNFGKISGLFGAS